MLKSLGRSIFTFFARPAPTSVALMVGQPAGVPANDDQSQLRRAMIAAAAAEEMCGDADDSVTVQMFEPFSFERDDSAAAQAAVFAPANATPPVAANEPVWDTLDVEEIVAPLAEGPPADVLDQVLAVEDGVAFGDEAPADLAVDEDAPELDALPVADAEAVVETDLVAAPPEDVVAEQLTEEPAIVVVEEVPASVPDDVLAEALVAAAVEEDAADEVVEKKPRKKRVPAKRKAATKAPRKAKAVEEAVEAVLEDDVWVSDAVAWSLSGEWADGAQLETESSDCPRRLEELREAAADGRLTIWGRSGDAGTWQPIEAAYWKSGTVEVASLTQGRENVVAEPKTKGRAKAARKYSALKVSRAQVEELWHPDAMH